MAWQQSPDFESPKVLSVRFEDGENGHSIDLPAVAKQYRMQVQTQAPSSTLSRGAGFNAWRFNAEPLFRRCVGAVVRGEPE
jgi:hypothetical protein